MHPDVIEAQLAHGKSGPLGAAYDRAEFLEQRRHMMNTWADYLEELRDEPRGTAPFEDKRPSETRNAPKHVMSPSLKQDVRTPTEPSQRRNAAGR